MQCKIKNWDVGCIIKWYGITEKITFWDYKIEYDRISRWECSLRKWFWYQIVLGRISNSNSNSEPHFQGPYSNVP